eukprot:12497789-Heterocapsa_arctica.AAC.1
MYIIKPNSIVIASRSSVSGWRPYQIALMPQCVAAGYCQSRALFASEVVDVGGCSEGIFPAPCWGPHSSTTPKFGLQPQHDSCAKMSEKKK